MAEHGSAGGVARAGSGTGSEKAISDSRTREVVARSPFRKVNGLGEEVPLSSSPLRADYQVGWQRIDPPRDGIEAYRNVVNVVNGVNGMEALLSTTSPEAGKPQRAAAVEVARDDRPRRRPA